jgi:hypothetical protein
MSRFQIHMQHDELARSPIKKYRFGVHLRHDASVAIYQFPLNLVITLSEFISRATCFPSAELARTGTLGF